MTRDELEQILQGQELLKTLDVKTLVLDLMREMTEEDLVKIFWDRLDVLSADYVRDYLYMKRS